MKVKIMEIREKKDKDGVYINFDDLIKVMKEENIFTTDVEKIFELYFTFFN